LWKLNINYDKTKILVFGDRNRRNRNIVVDNHEIETVDSFKFLGVMFSKKTYGCEVWGFGDLSMIEKVQTDFLQHMLNFKKSTLHMMLYGELGRFPISIFIKKENFGFLV